MTRVSIFFNPLNAASRVDHELVEGSRLIDFLVQEYPDGFNGMLRVFVGTEELEIDDLDYSVGANEQVTMLVMPAGPDFGITFTTILISTLISTAIGFVISYLFPPKAPKGLRGVEESPTYSISATRNRARLNEPIAVHFGTDVSYPPDYASAPYTFYQLGSDDMYVDMLFCIGHAEYTVSEIFIGDTPIDTLEPGSVSYWLYGPTDHNQVIGTIAADITSQIADSSNPWPFRENTFTSPEVDGFEFNGDSSEATGTPTVFTGACYAGSFEDSGGGGFIIYGRVEGIPDTEPVQPGDRVTLANTVSNNVTFTVGSVIDKGDGTLKVYEDAFPGVIADENPLPGGATYQVNSVASNMKAGPFRAQKKGQQIDSIDVDIEFPNGLMRFESDGDQREHTVEFDITYQQIDEADGSPIGAPIVRVARFTGKQRTSRRGSWASGALTAGAYEVTVERTTAFATNGRYIEECRWTGLKGNVVLDVATPAYGPVTMLAMRLKATSGLGQAAQSRVRVTATRNFASGSSDNPATVVRDIWTNSDYGMGQPLSRLDDATLTTLETQWAAAGGPRFNGSFDQRNTGLEAMDSVVSLAGASVKQYNGLTTVVPDQVRQVRSALFSTANMDRNSFEVDYTFDHENDFDGVEVEFRDANFNAVYYTYPVSATNPESFLLFGCTDQTYAEEFAVYLWNVKQKRRKLVTFTTELEGLIPRFGDRIGVGHPVPNWGQSGVVIASFGGDQYQVDAALDWSGGPHEVLFRNERGEPHGPYTVTQGTTSDIMVVAGPITETIYDPIGQEPTSYLFGESAELVRDFIVSRISPRGEDVIEIEGQVYDEDIYIGAPPHMSVPV